MSLLKIDVDSNALAEEVGNLSGAEIDSLPFGAIRLAADGTVLSYNSAEEKISGRRRDDVIGRNFFAEIAPCTRVRAFFGAFEEGLKRRNLNEIFDFTFRFPGGPKEVRIRMIYSEPVDSVWIFVTPLN
jgi:photoactive yellow protein